MISTAQRTAPIDGLILALDTGSPIVSAAVGRAGEILAERRTAQAKSTERLMGMIAEILQRTDLRPADLAGIVALRGPGSFTGLRIGLATAMGLHQALERPATTLPTLEVLASCAPQEGARTLAVVDALRGDWSAQPFLSGRPPRALAEPSIEAEARLGRHSPELLIGFGARRLVESSDHLQRSEALEPESLASATLRLLVDRPPEWNPASLMEPLYLRPPAAVPGPRRRR